MKANTPAERLVNGIIKENPTFVLVLGMCPTLAVTTSAINGIGMGLTTTVVLAMSNLMISLLRKFIPDGVRMPAFIVVVASFVTIVQMLLQGFIPSLYSALGIYIPLIVVNCIILGRAEAYASKNPPIPSLFDGIGMGLGFTLSITCIGAVRELLGAGQLFGHQILPLAADGKFGYEPITIFRTNSRSVLPREALTRVKAADAAQAAIPATTQCAKEARKHERIITDPGKFCDRQQRSLKPVPRTLPVLRCIQENRNGSRNGWCDHFRYHIVFLCNRSDLQLHPGTDRHGIFTDDCIYSHHRSTCSVC